MTQVIIDDIVPRTQLVAAAGQTVFNTNWTVNATTDVVVYARADGVEADDETQEVSPNDYNVTLIGGSQTVRVTFLVGRTLDDIITIVRNTPAERLNLYINTNFVPSMLNNDFGILTLVDQQAQMYDTVINPRYNVSAIIEPDSIIGGGDIVLPILKANEIWAKNPANTEIIAYGVPSSGSLAPGDATYILQTPNADLPNAQALSDLSSGIVVNDGGVLLSRVLTGTADQITIANGTGVAGNPTFSIATDPILPGTGSVTINKGTTAQRPGSPITGMLRFNTNINSLEVYTGAWTPVSGGLVNSVVGTLDRIVVDSTDPINPIVDISPNYVGQSSITTLGTITTGTWEGDTVAIGFGGTGLGTTPINGELLIGNGTNYTLSTLTAGTGISITNGTGSITINSSTGGLLWFTTLGTTQAAAINNGYVSGNVAQTTFTLPATAAVGDVVAVEGLGAGGWILAANTGQTIKIGSSTTISAGNLTSAAASDNVYVTCIVANTTWRVKTTNSAGLTIN